jgi:glycerol kinase
VTETTALGAACLAGLAVGFWHSPEDLRSSRKADMRFEPKMDRAEAARLKARWHQAVERSKSWVE